MKSAAEHKRESVGHSQSLKCAKDVEPVIKAIKNGGTLRDPHRKKEFSRILLSFPKLYFDFAATKINRLVFASEQLS